ncbi:hypothetical protein CH373_07240 [Leptospira perolatii]|uniref:Uncharacterized protein n=1 Tax=Leptospira perolatii TaxID=2023191 RepID=A0A2M9ZPR5_9LEPT|nr:hypothetical protein [Leptospira perolatii]PJZ70714.1 hypothetical protein CH360_04100 [Leptospira perolatii]PJZ73923.1 hypothetical protein CH373_07240 [Leptospira perolatii]
MEIKIFKREKRNLLVCTKQDGSFEKSDLGPNTPIHDLAHFIVESYFGLKQGFFGNIYQGYSVSELSTKEIIRTLPIESLVSELLARTLQSLWSGACTDHEFQVLIQSEFRIYSISYPLEISNEDVWELYLQYDDLVSRWNRLKEGDHIVLEFSVTV